MSVIGTRKIHLMKDSPAMTRVEGEVLGFCSGAGTFRHKTKYIMNTETPIGSYFQSPRLGSCESPSSKAASRMRPGWVYKTLNVALWLLPLCFAAGGQEATPLITLAESNFEANTESWLGANSGFGSESLTRLQGGPTANSLWYISVSENSGDGTAMFFSAPAKYLGDKRNAYHGILSFNLKQSATSDLSGSGSFVQLSSPTLSVVYSLPKVPPTTWKHYEVPLDEAKGWFHQAEDRPATQKEFLSVLANLQRLWIRAEYSYNNVDRTDLDDVQMLGNPPGKSEPTMTAVSLPSLMIHGTAGRQYQINYSDILKLPMNWITLTNLVIPSNDFVFVDRSKPQGISRFYTIKLMAE